MGVLVPSCVWKVSAQLIVAIDARFGEPVDAYINGSQTWLRDDGPGGEAIEWRLHPVPGFQRPSELSHHELFPSIALALGTGEEPLAAPESLWDGLEGFPAYGDEIEPAPLAKALTDALGIAPDAVGLVDHDVIAETWERSRGALSIVDALLQQLHENR